MTAIEVGIVAVLRSFVIGKFIYRGSTWTEFYHEMVECALDSGLIIFWIRVPSPVAWVLIAEEIPQHMLAWPRCFAHASRSYRPAALEWCLGNLHSADQPHTVGVHFALV